MWLLDLVKGLFGGKGTTQIGNNRNETVTETNTNTVSGVSVGGNGSNLTVANTVNQNTYHLHNAVPAETKTIAFSPTPEEVEILQALAAPDATNLQLVKADTNAQFFVLLNGQPTADPLNTEACVRYIEAVQRLRGYKLLSNHSGDGQVFHLSASGRAAEKQLGVGPAPIKLQPHNVYFRFYGTDAGGGESVTTRANAKYVLYGFEVNAFNSRAQNIGLMDFTLHFAKSGRVIHEQVPTEHTGEIRFSARYCPEVKTRTLPAGEWQTITFEGGVGGEKLETIADCDEIYLTAKSIDGEQFRIPLANRILESS